MARAAVESFDKLKADDDDDDETKIFEPDVSVLKVGCISRDPLQVYEQIAIMCFEVAQILGTQKEVARCLLYEYSWNASELADVWFSDSAAVLQKAKLKPRRSKEISEASLCVSGFKRSFQAYCEAANEENCSPTSSLVSTKSSSASVFLNEEISDVCELPLSATSSLQGSPSKTQSSSSTERVFLETSIERERKYQKKSPTRTCLFFCPILCIECDAEDTTALACGHRYSNSFWRGYLSSSLSSGAYFAVTLRCPAIDCNELLPEDLWLQFATDNEVKTFKEFLVDLFVERHPNFRWCPSATCEKVVERVGPQFSDGVCVCGRRFCFSCGEEPHHKLGCDAVLKWKLLSDTEGESVRYIFKNTKLCPSCTRAIEKHQGCMRMRCHCGHKFCWLCLSPLKDDHAAFCFVNKESKKNLMVSETLNYEISKELYAHCLRRYHEHEHAQYRASHITLQMTQVAVNALTKYYGLKHDGCFLLDAIYRIVELRRDLKWSYVLLFFAKWEEEHFRALFELQIGLQECLLDFLQEKMETLNFSDYLGGYDAETEFCVLKLEILGLLSVIEEFDRNLRKAFDEAMPTIQTNAYEAEDTILGI